MSFTDAGSGNRPPKATKSKDGAFPTKQAASVRKNTGKNAVPRASRGYDGNTPKIDDTNVPDMESGANPAHGKPVGAKFSVSAMSQAMKGRASKKGFYGGGAS